MSDPKQGAVRTSSLCQHYLMIFSVRNDCLAVIAVSAFKIYATTNSSDEEFPWLLLLRPVAVELDLRGIPRSVAGHDGMCLVGICNFQARLIFISRDPVIPPKTEILGPLKCGLITSLQQFGTMMLFFLQELRWLPMTWLCIPLITDGCKGEMRSIIFSNIFSNLLIKLQKNRKTLPGPKNHQISSDQVNSWIFGLMNCSDGSNGQKCHWTNMNIVPE